MRARQNPSQSEPTSPSSSDASPKEPGAAAPGPTPAPSDTGDTLPGETAVAPGRKEAFNSQGADRRKRARECGGIVRVK